MAKMYGGNVKSDTVNAHKAMAGATDKGNFGVGPLPQRAGMHPDATSHAGRKPPMDDSARSPAHKGMMGAPDHGAAGQDHFTRGGKL